MNITAPDHLGAVVRNVFIRNGVNFDSVLKD